MFDQSRKEQVDTLIHIRNTLESDRITGAADAVHHQVELDRTRDQLQQAVRDGRAGELRDQPHLDRAVEEAFSERHIYRHGLGISLGHDPDRRGDTEGNHQPCLRADSLSRH